MSGGDDGSALGLFGAYPTAHVLAFDEPLFWSLPFLRMTKSDLKQRLRS